MEILFLSKDLLGDFLKKQKVKKFEIFYKYINWLKTEEKILKEFYNRYDKKILIEISRMIGESRDHMMIKYEESMNDKIKTYIDDLELKIRTINQIIEI